MRSTIFILFAILFSSCVSKKKLVGTYFISYGPSSSVVKIGPNGNFSQRIAGDLMGDSTLTAQWSKKGNTIYLEVEPQEWFIQDTALVIEKDSLSNKIILNIHFPDTMLFSNFYVGLNGKNWQIKQDTMGFNIKDFTIVFENKGKVQQITIDAIGIRFDYIPDRKKSTLYEVFLVYDGSIGTIPFPIVWKYRNGVIYPIYEKGDRIKDSDPFVKQKE